MLWVQMSGEAKHPPSARTQPTLTGAVTLYAPACNDCAIIIHQLLLICHNIKRERCGLSFELENVGQSQAKLEKSGRKGREMTE